MKSIRGTQSNIFNSQQQTFGFTMHLRHEVILDVEPALNVRQDSLVEACT